MNKPKSFIVALVSTWKGIVICMSVFLNIGNEIRIVAGQMAPYLLFGFLAAGALHVLVSPAWMRRHLGGRGIMPVIKSVLLGVPLPLCSCGVIAVTASIRKQGAGRGAATGFLLATPQTGVDSIFATWGMLGPAMGVFRPLIALVTGIVGGGLAALFDKDAKEESHAAHRCGDVCQDDERPERSLREILRYGLVTLPRDIARPLIVGVILAGAIAALAPRDMLAPYIGGGILAMLVMTVVGTPLYVCATASIPVAVSFMHLGASPGAALAFLIAGPATNAATITTVWKIMGRQTAGIYLATVIVSSVAAGLLFDALSGWSWVVVLHDMRHAHDHHADTGLWNIAFATLLALVVVNSLYGDQLMRLLPGRTEAKSTKGEHAAAHIELAVKGMTCSHCVNAVTRALREAAGTQNVTVDLSSGRAVVASDNVDAAILLQAVADLGYEVSQSGR